MASILPSLQVEVTGYYKGGTRIWTNRHYLSGGVPANGTEWAALAAAVAASFKDCLTGNSTITGYNGYLAGSDVPVYNATVSISGTLSVSGTGSRTPLGNVALVRWSTASRSSKNHPVYLYSYVHDVCYDNTVAGDDFLWGSQKTPLQTYAGDWVSGFSDGTHTLIRASAQGHIATGALVEDYISHRDFPYQSSV